MTTPLTPETLRKLAAAATDHEKSLSVANHAFNVDCSANNAMRVIETEADLRRAKEAVSEYASPHLLTIADRLEREEQYQFIPDSSGGHIVAHGKVWRPTEEKPDAK